MTAPVPGPTPADMPLATALPGARPGRRVKRRDVWVVAADPERPTVGCEIWSNRPALVVSADTVNDHYGVAAVVYLTSSTNKLTSPTRVELDPIGSAERSVALCEQIHTVDSSRLLRRIGEVPRRSMRDIDAALSLTLSIGRSPDGHGLFRKWEEYIRSYGIDMAAEITALAGRTADERIDALQSALNLAVAQRDAYRTIIETRQESGDAIQRLADAGLGTVADRLAGQDVASDTERQAP